MKCTTKTILKTVVGASAASATAFFVYKFIKTNKMLREQAAIDAHEAQLEIDNEEANKSLAEMELVRLQASEAITKGIDNSLAGDMTGNFEEDIKKLKSVVDTDSVIHFKQPITPKKDEPDDVSEPVKIEQGNKATDWSPAPGDIFKKSATDAYVDWGKYDLTKEEGVSGEMRFAKSSMEAANQYKQWKLSSINGGSWVYRVLMLLFDKPYAPQGDTRGDAMYESIVENRSSFFGDTSIWTDNVSISDAILWIALKMDYDFDGGVEKWAEVILMNTNLNHVNTEYELDLYARRFSWNQLYDENEDGQAVFGPFRLLEEQMEDTEESYFQQYQDWAVLYGG